MNHVITIYNHDTHPIWSSVYQMTFETMGRTNGAYTYSQDITKYHIPVIEKILDKQNKYKNILIVSVGSLVPNIMLPETDLVIVYLHESLERESPRIESLKDWFKGDVIFITARLDLYKWVLEYGYKAIHLPMAIDASALEKYIKPDDQKHKGLKVIWFGNKYMGKDKTLKNVRGTFLSRGWQFDELSYNKLNNGDTLSKEDCLNLLSKYRYGVGVGRCYLEMCVLGIKSIICSTDVNGIITNEEEFQVHKDNNFVGGSDLYTFSKDINVCIDNITEIMAKTLDIKDVLPILKKELGRVICQ